MTCKAGCRDIGAICICNMPPTFDPKKPVVSRSGLPARIICTDRKGTHPIVGLIVDGHDAEFVQRYHTDGRVTEENSPDDLINVKMKKWKWIVKYEHNEHDVFITGHKSEEEIGPRGAPAYVGRIVGRIQESLIEE